MNSAGALYYPYIHISSTRWLKASLLIFPKVQRMVPYGFAPLDTEEIKSFTKSWAGKEPLLGKAELWSDRSQTAQRILASKLQIDAHNPTFLRKFGRDSARKGLSRKSKGFQIHAGKLNDDLRSILMQTTLSWKPLSPEDYGNRAKEYVELHPRVGEAVMSTLAVACAHGSGLDIVGDARSGQLHRCLVEKDMDSIYSTWLSEPDALDPPQKATGEELMDFVLGFKADLSKLTIPRLHEIAAEREPINKLLSALREHAAKIPAMDPGPKRQEFFMQAADEVMLKWQEDKKNLSGFAREFFGTELTKISSDFVGKATGKLVDAAASAAAGVAAGSVWGLGPGLFVGLLTHAGTSYNNTRKREFDSPYRFLTTLEKEGVIFRGEISPN